MATQLPCSVNSNVDQKQLEVKSLEKQILCLESKWIFLLFQWSYLYKTSSLKFKVKIFFSAKVVILVIISDENPTFTIYFEWKMFKNLY